MKTTTFSQTTFLVELTESELTNIASVLMAAQSHNVFIGGASEQIIELAEKFGLVTSF